MPKHIFKRWSPDPTKIRANPALRFLGVVLHDPHLFHLNRHSISMAFFVGLFIAFLPVPGQVPLAALGALVFRCNLPISIALVWVTNPLTYPIILYGVYKVGAALLQLNDQTFAIEMSWEWLQVEFNNIWKPILLGSVIASLFFSCLGYITVQWTWRWHVVKKWSDRKVQRIKNDKPKA